MEPQWPLVFNRRIHCGQTTNGERVPRMIFSNFIQPSPEKLASQAAKWRARLDEKSVLALARCRRLYTMGYIGTLLFVALFLMFNHFGAPNLGPPFAITAISCPCIFSYFAFRQARKLQSHIRSENSITGRFRPPLTFRILSSPELYDGWLLAQRSKT